MSKTHKNGKDKNTEKTSIRKQNMTFTKIRKQNMTFTKIRKQNMTFTHKKLNFCVIKCI